MATAESFIKHVLDQANLGSRFTCRKMFGEYGFHLDGKFIALACDNSFYIKDTAALSKYGLELPTRSPYPGAKPYPLADELLNNPDILASLLLDTAANLPEPKPKASKKRKEA
jgi:TfoX/Sxy family transcriptional regulator of competence genes